VLLFVLDGKEGLLPADRALAQEIRKLNKPTLVLVNKADTNASHRTMEDAEQLGLGEILGVSAAHQMGLGELQDAILALLPPLENMAEEHDDDTILTDEKPVLKLAIVGRPNAGKSTLINTLLGEARMLAGPIAGLTRESITTRWERNGQVYELIDTPGQRKKAKVVDALEKAMTESAREAIAEASVVVLLVDASPFDPTTGIHRIVLQQDAAIVQLVLNAGKPLVVGLNKWDGVADKAKAREMVEAHITTLLSGIKGVPCLPLTATTGKGVPEILNTVHDVFTRWHTKMSTSKLNRALDDVQARRLPPLANNQPVRMKYMTQVDTCPPHFMVFGSRVASLPESYKRYMLNHLRTLFGLEGIPMKLTFKSTRNPFVDR
ncbi:MAG: ribosome biogenesis GTPase Der, partial [Alphaproteobacteria bacterium]